MNNSTTLQETKAVTAEELTAFVTALSETYHARLVEAYPTCDLNWGTVVAEPGRKYARLVAVGKYSNSRSAMGFIDLTNGDILKSAGWSAPAKHARGNIRVGDVTNLWNNAFTGHSSLCVAYLR